MFGIELFSFLPRVMLEAAFFLAVSICEAGVFLVDLHSEHHPLVSRLSAGSLSRCPPCMGSCLCLSVPAPPHSCQSRNFKGPETTPAPRVKASFRASIHLHVPALTGCLLSVDAFLYHWFSDASSMTFKNLIQHVQSFQREGCLE